MNKEIIFRVLKIFLDGTVPPVWLWTCHKVTLLNRPQRGVVKYFFLSMLFTLPNVGLTPRDLQPNARASDVCREEQTLG